MKKNGGEEKSAKGEHYSFADYKKEIFKDPEARARCEKAFAELKLAHQIAELREKAHMTQAKLAVEINTKQQVVSRLEGEHHIPSFTTLWKVAQAFGKTLDIRFI
jgi:DNA-binding XRE family transcriptional regulator